MYIVFECPACDFVWFANFAAVLQNSEWGRGPFEVCLKLVWGWFVLVPTFENLMRFDTGLAGLCRSISNFQSQFQVIGLIFRCVCFEFSLSLALSYLKHCLVWCCQTSELACCLQYCFSGLILYQYSCAGSCLVWHVTGCRLCRNRSWMSLFMISFAIYTSWLYCRICCDFRFVLYRPVWLDYDSLHEFWAGWPCGCHAIDLYDLLWFCSSILDFASRPKIGSCVTPPYALAQIWAKFWGD